MDELQTQNLELRIQVAKLQRQLVELQQKLIGSEARFQIVKLDPVMRALDSEIALLEAQVKPIETSEIVSQPE